MENTDKLTKIKKEVEVILSNFKEDMKDIEVKSDFVLKREKCFREENAKAVSFEKTLEFKQDFLSNAKNANSDYILTKKGDWV